MMEGNLLIPSTINAMDYSTDNTENSVMKNIKLFLQL